MFSAGCHSGYNLVDGDAIPGVTLPLDWAQAFARKKATLIAGTGYQYGDTDFLEYSERLYNNFARQLRAGTGRRSPVGEALVQAKLAYLAATPDIRGIHEKALLEATLFGLPMLGVNMPAGRGAGRRHRRRRSRRLPVGVGPGRDARPRDLRPRRRAEPHAAHANASRIVAAAVPTSPPRWLSGPDGVRDEAGRAGAAAGGRSTSRRPIRSVVLRGVGFRGGTYVDSGPIVPFTGAPTTELRGVHVPFVSPVFYPERDVDAELLRRAGRQRRHAACWSRRRSIAPPTSSTGRARSAGTPASTCACSTAAT